VGREGTRLLKVEFEKTGDAGDDEDGEVHLSVTCEDGSPSFRRE